MVAILDPELPADAQGNDKGGGRSVSADRGIVAFVDRYGDRASEILWTAALAMLERAADEARESAYIGRRGWWSDPSEAIAALRADVERALELADLAVAIQADENHRHHTIVHDLGDALAITKAGRPRTRRRRAELR